MFNKIKLCFQLCVFMLCLGYLLCADASVYSTNIKDFIMIKKSYHNYTKPSKVNKDQLIKELQNTIEWQDNENKRLMEQINKFYFDKRRAEHNLKQATKQYDQHIASLLLREFQNKTDQNKRYPASVNKDCVYNKGVSICIN